MTDEMFVTYLAAMLAVRDNQDLTAPHVAREYRKMAVQFIANSAWYSGGDDMARQVATQKTDEADAVETKAIQADALRQK